MKSLKLSLAAAVFAAGAMAGSSAWAGRGEGHFERAHPGQFPISTNSHRDHDRSRGRNHDAWRWGLGLLAGSAILLAATQPRVVAVAPPAPVYVPPLAHPRGRIVYAPPTNYSAPTSPWWYYCAQTAGYYPYVTYCPSGWTRVPATPSW